MVVKKPWRGRKIGSSLYSKILEGRHEERVVLTSSPDTAVGYLMWQHYGFRKVGTALQEEGTVLEFLLLDLHETPAT
jgi:predicted GNAT family N-acyltransferase